MLYMYGINIKIYGINSENPKKPAEPDDIRLGLMQTDLTSDLNIRLNQKHLGLL